MSDATEADEVTNIAEESPAPPDALQPKEDVIIPDAEDGPGD